MLTTELNAGFLIGAAIGSGSNARAVEHGGADFLLAINAGRLRNMGVPSIASMLPVLDANSLTEGFAREELLALCRKPVLLGVNVWGRTFNPEAQAAAIGEAGFAGAVNFPSCMHYSRPMQQILSRAGRGIEQEVELLKAVQDAGMMSMFYCSSRTQARLAADAGLDLVCLNIGWNVGGAMGHRSRSTIEEVAIEAREIGRLIKRISPKTRFLLEGGPIAAPEDLSRVLSLAPLDGYVGGSTIDRLPLEASVASMIDGFRRASMRPTRLDDESLGLVNWAKQFGFVGQSEVQLMMLRRLRALSSANDPVLIVAEPGQNSLPAVRALGAIKARSRSLNMVQIDVAEQDLPARARNVLFGRRDSSSARPPILTDSTVELVVIRAPERLTQALQRRLARALRDGVFRMAGSRRMLNIEPRIVLQCDVQVQEDTVVEDLLGAGLEPELVSHMAGWTLRLPPLRERISDLVALIETEAEGGHLEFSSGALQRLQAHDWPENEAELHTVLGRLAGRSSRLPVQADELEPLLRTAPNNDRRQKTRSEKDLIVDTLWRNGFNRTKAAEALGISRKTLYNKIMKYGLSG
ncbi:phosphoenolpyruvate hydrolase family protein [uncultured Sneathiella sp.]|uniref:phosphoenolpyruvate hydrolase family protein n=1 Tax=uncultured Sneathiella sp. TaxID=879315 RepID=UPI002599B6B7|nr:phosphoenolpyruvate hydrolase family protein [uncultured Sneathiella sp.]